MLQVVFAVLNGARIATTAFDVAEQRALLQRTEGTTRQLVTEGDINGGQCVDKGVTTEAWLECKI